MEFCVLGSGSAGNSTILRHGGTCILVDAGLSARQLVRRLEMVGVDPDALSGIVLTHEHSDHTGGLDVFLRKRDIPVYCEIRTREVLRQGLRSEICWNLFENGDRFRVGNLEVTGFSIPHDAVEPLGYVFQGLEGSRFGLLSDIGKVTNLVRHHLRGVDSLFVEANYDDHLLQLDTKRPWATKQRISGDHGHLSNAQAAELVAEIAGDNLHRVVLGHISRDCNAPDVALQTVRDALRHVGRPDVLVDCAGQDEPLPFLRVRREPDQGLAVEEPGLSETDDAMIPGGRSLFEVTPPVPSWRARHSTLFEF